MSNPDSDNNEIDEQEVLAHLDPSVAALLLDQKEDASASDLRIKIAHMKMQQARIRGNSDYAAKVMDFAIDEGARDKAAWMLLEKHISKLETQVSGMVTVVTTNGNNNGSGSTSAAETTNNNGEETQEKESGYKEGEEDQETPEGEEEDIRQKIAQEKERANTLEELLEQSLYEEIQAIQSEQANVNERQERIRSRIRFLQLTLKTASDKMSSEKLAKLQKAMTEVYEYEQPKSTENQINTKDGTISNKLYCSICHERSATKAVIPCGHLCLCDKCADTMNKLDTQIIDWFDQTYVIHLCLV